MDLITVFFVSYAIPIFLLVVGGGIILFVWWYIRLRMRCHEKGILHINYCGWKDRNNPKAVNLFQLMAAERRYNRRIRKENR